MTKNVLADVWLEGFIAGLREYAWWKDGTQYVGSCGTTLKEAIEQGKRDYSAEAHLVPCPNLTQEEKTT